MGRNSGKRSHRKKIKTTNQVGGMDHHDVVSDPTRHFAMVTRYVGNNNVEVRELEMTVKDMDGEVVVSGTGRIVSKVYPLRGKIKQFRTPAAVMAKKGKGARGGKIRNEAGQWVLVAFEHVHFVYLTPQDAVKCGCPVEELTKTIEGKKEEKKEEEIDGYVFDYSEDELDVDDI